MAHEKLRLKLENAKREKEKEVADMKVLERIGRDCEYLGRRIVNTRPSDKGGTDDKEIIYGLLDIVATFASLRGVGIKK